MKERGERIPVLTAYDAPTARILDEAGIPVLLVGDSLAMVVLGYENTTTVTMAEMLHHTRSVVRGSQKALVVADMPFMSYTVTVERALDNAARFIQEAGAQAVKIEGGERVAHTIRRMVDGGVPVMGHLGLTPQQVLNLGGYKVQGRSVETAERIVRDAILVEEAGAFALVLECIPAPLGQLVSESLRIPTIGIGAGAGCDGQVQVVHDILGLCPGFQPKHAKVYATLAEEIGQAVGRYAEEVRTNRFPAQEQSYGMDADLVRVLRERIRSEGWSHAAP
jgi:3-methyl-2-oxobutanoate hydroxymethyltransferase